MDQFDKKIKKTLAKGPRHEPDSNVWGRIAPHLTSAGQGAAVSWVRPLQMSAALLAVAGLFYWLGARQGISSRNMEVELEKLSQTIAALQNVQGKLPERIIDTIVVRDTIWHVYYPDQQIGQNVVKDQPQKLASTSIGDDKIASLFSPEIFHTFSAVANESKQILENNYRKLVSAQKVILPSDKGSLENDNTFTHRSNTTINKYQLLELRGPSISTTYRRNIQLHPYRGLMADQIIKVEKSRRFWNALLPDRIRLGGVVGGFNPIKHDTEHTQEWIGGLQTELLFSPRISFLTGLRYRYLHYKSEGEHVQSNYPIPDDMQTGDQLKELYATLHYLNVPLLFKYSYPLSEKLFPYLHTGILIGGIQKQKYKYEIERNGQELKLKTEGEGTPWTINSYLLGLGLEYNPSARVTLTGDIEGRYHFNTQEIEYDNNNGVGMRLGLYYSF